MLPEARTDLDDLADLTRYQIELEVDAEHQRFNGNAVLQVTNTEDTPLDALYFRLLPNGHKSYGNGSLVVSQALVDGQEAQLSLSHEDTVLQVQLPDTLEVGASLQVSVEFTGVIPLDYGSEENRGYVIFNQTEGVISLAGWYPMLAVYDAGGWHQEPISTIGDSGYSDMAFYEVDVTAPAEMRVAATGVEVATVPGNPTTSHRFVSGPARDFFLTMSADFQIASRQVDGVRLNAYTLPGQEQAGQAVLQVAADALEIFNQKFGAYPLSELDVVATPLQYALGVEFPGIVLVASDEYADPESQALIGTIAHEVAHQWWYNLIGNDVFAEPWLDESLATYSMGLFYEGWEGVEAYQGYVQYLQTRYAVLVSDGLDDVVTQPLAYFEELKAPRVYGSVAYSKGALFYHLLRQEIGDEAFFSALQSYYRAHRYQIATTQDLLEAFNQAASQSLDDFFQEWLYSAK